MLQYVFKDDEAWMFSAYDQCWDADTLKELEEKHNVVFMTMGNGVKPVMFIMRDGENPLIVIGVEDDGTITFERKYGQFTCAMDMGWVPHLVCDLMRACAIAERRKENET